MLDSPQGGRGARILEGCGGIHGGLFGTLFLLAIEEIREWTGEEERERERGYLSKVDGWI